MRNNMTASMFDLSAAGKSRSRLGKFKDKVRGKKKESDAASTAVPSFPQVLMDSEEEEGNRDGEVAAGKDEKKKKKKMKSLFSPKSNLQRNMSQSMSVLPAKNSLSGSQSSGLNVDSSEGCNSLYRPYLIYFLLPSCVITCMLTFPMSSQVKRSSSS